MLSGFPITDEAACAAMLVRLMGGDAALFNRSLAEALSHENPHGLSDMERMAVWVYSNTDQRWYVSINQELRSGSPLDDYRFFAALLNETLEKLPRHSAEVFRGVRFPDINRIADHFIEAYDTGRELVWLAFTSSSRLIGKAFEGNVLLTIFSQNGRVLGLYAHRPSEEEILFRAGSRFIVTYVNLDADLVVVGLNEVAGTGIGGS
ncbi:MAG: ADP-ribosyltransferase domain-containing protein [Microvirga sp.]